jgi:5,6-dimethylbenzimidazole synthase
MHCPEQLAALLRMPDGSQPMAVLSRKPVYRPCEQSVLQAEKSAARNGADGYVV